ncbi:Speckle-type POZ protein-like B, partial [Stegodyphus mimosarum]
MLIEQLAEGIPAMEKQHRNTDQFVFTWVIENFSMWIPYEQYLFSPRFILNSLPDMEWYIVFYPTQRSERNCRFFFLQRTGFLPQRCTVNCDIQILDSHENLILKRELIFDRFSSAYDFTCFCIKHHSWKFLTDDVLIIQCNLQAVEEKDNNDPLPQISYENGLFTDATLRAGDALFRVHKAMLWARWPKLLEKIGSEANFELVMDVRPAVLEAMLQYVYSGKLDCSKSNSLKQLSSAVARYELPNLSSAAVVAQKARTRIYGDKVSLEWPIINASSLPVGTELQSQVFTVNKLTTQRWYLIFHVGRNVYGRVYEIFICRVCDHKSQPTFVTTKISFDKNHSKENEQELESDAKWKCASLSQSDLKDPYNVLKLKCELKFCINSHSSEITESSYAFVSSLDHHHFISDLRKLYRSEIFSDVIIVAGSKSFCAHKFILCAQSPVFFKMFQTEMAHFVTIPNVDPDVIDQMLIYMYTGKVLESFYKFTELYSVAVTYDISDLKKICMLRLYS